MGINVRMKGFDRILRSVIASARVVKGENRKFLQDANRQIWNSIHLNFTSRGRPPWPERADDNPWPILIKSGVLMTHTLSSVGRVWNRRGQKWVKVIYSPWYGYIHQYANSLATRIRQRKYVLFTQDERRKMIKTVLKAIDGSK